MLKTTSNTAANKGVKVEVKEGFVYEFSYTRANPYTNQYDVPTWTLVKRTVLQSEAK